MALSNQTREIQQKGHTFLFLKGLRVEGENVTLVRGEGAPGDWCNTLKESVNSKLQNNVGLGFILVFLPMILP